MTAPLDFLKDFAARMRGAGIRFAITSGMACVHYGIQQTTKDSDWIIPPEDLERFRDFLETLERQTLPWRVSYRTVFGAPLEADYLAHGWTSHISVRDRADAAEHHVDLFGKPPRVARIDTDPDDPAFASRHVVAQMKRTDRDRDWPIVDALGLQLRVDAPELALRHIQDPALLLEAWRRASRESRDAAAVHRPLLNLVPGISDPDRLDAWLRLERILWETVNQERYSVFERAWKEFYRRWRSGADTDLHPQGAFVEQHVWLLRAAAEFGLPQNPLNDEERERVYQRAAHRAALRSDSTPDKIDQVKPPIEEMLP